MEKQLLVFNNKEFGEVRVVMINGTPWFVGTDVAVSLGYKDAFAALKQHVDDEDKLVWQITSAGQKRDATVINESGLYSMILRSNLPKAREFKHWVTAEVIPAIRKTGSYSIAQPQSVLLKAASEIDRRWREVLKATYPPELWKALQSLIPCRQSDSQGAQTPPEP